MAQGGVAIYAQASCTPLKYSEINLFLVSWHLVLWLGKNILIPRSIYKNWSLILSAFERRDACRQCCLWLQSFCSTPHEVERQILGEKEPKEFRKNKNLISVSERFNMPPASVRQVGKGSNL